MKKAIYIWAIIIYLLIGIFYSHPIILNFNNSLPYSYHPAEGFEKVNLIEGDYLQLFYSLWLFKDYFISPGQNFFKEPYEFSIPWMPRPYTPRELPLSILFLIFSIFGNISAYNCLVLFSFIASGLAMFTLCRYYTKNNISALIGGIIFSIFPFRLAQLFGGHPNGFIIFWFPLIIYFYEKLWETGKCRYGWLAGVCIFLMGIEELHLGYFSALFTIVFWLYKICETRPDPCEARVGVPRRGLVSHMSVVISWLITGVYLGSLKFLVLGRAGVSTGRGLDEIRLYAPTISELFSRITLDSEKYIYLGIPCILLAVIFIAYEFREILKSPLNKIKGHLPWIFYILVFIGTTILSLGPNSFIPIYKICYKIVPFFNYPRSPGRWISLSAIALCILSSKGICIILTRPKKYLSCIIITLAILIDFHTSQSIGISRLKTYNKTYEYIKQSVQTGPILEIPIWPGDSSWSSIYEYYITRYKGPIINGYSSFVTKDYIDQIFWPLCSINMGILDNKQYELLRKVGVNFILLHEEAYPQKVSPFPFRIALENLKRSSYTKFIISDGPVYLFQVLTEPLSRPSHIYTIPSKTGVFYECEYMPHKIGETIKDPDASGGRSLYADQPITEPMHLVFGPWQLFPPGRYKLLFRIKTGGPAKIEVTTDRGKMQIAHKDLDIADKYEDYILHFTINRLTELEFRIIYYGKGPIRADYVYLLCEEENDPVWHYEAEELFHIGRELDGAVYATPELDPPGNLIFGPWRRYPKGVYRVGFRLKAGEGSPLKSSILKVGDVKQELNNIPTEYKIYWLEITLDKPTLLEFQVEFLRKVPINVDSIEIESVS